MCENLTTADWIQIIIAVITVVGILTSMVISVITLKQNSKMIEESTRPVITIYKDTININTPIEYLVFKNFGSSSGTITNISYDEVIFKKLVNEQALDLNLFKYFKNITLAPNQKYFLRISTKECDIKNLKFSIKYKSSIKTYQETFNINLSQDYAISYVQQHQKSDNPQKEMYTISNSIQELIKRI